MPDSLSGIAPVTVLVCTRDRAVSLAEAVRSILENDHPDFELIVVDQSTDDLSEMALSEWRSDSRLRYTRSPTHGLAEARNIGMRMSATSIVAMTDDDCRVPPDWLRNLVAAFSSGDRVGVVMGNVLPAKHDRLLGFVPGYIRTQPYLASGIGDKHRVEGMAACMAVLTDAWVKVGGFDVMLGAGSRLQSSDETDFIIRVLLAGYQVYETPSAHVVHHGIRSWPQANPLVHGYLLGIGATLGKHLRCGNWSILRVFGALALRWMFGRPVVEYGFDPPRLLRLAGFLRGLKAGMTTPVNRESSLFVSTPSDSSVARREASHESSYVKP